MTNLRANSILLPQCNPIPFSQFSDSVILRKEKEIHISQTTSPICMKFGRDLHLWVL